MLEWLKVEKAASIIYNIISLLFDDEITVGKNTIRNRIRMKRYYRDVRKYCHAYFRLNNGTVLTNPVFNKWLRNDNTIKRLFDRTAETHMEITDEEFLDLELDRIKRNIEYPVDKNDVDAIRGFLKGLLVKHRRYREKYLSEDTKQIIQNEDRNAKNILNNIASLSGRYGQEILAAINDSRGTMSSAQENSIFKVLNTCFWEGQFEILENIQPILKEKSKDLYIWLSFALNRALINGDDYIIEYSINDIGHLNIREDAVRKAILFSYLNNKKMDANDFNVSAELKELLTKLTEGDSWLFNKKKEVKENIECYYLYPFSEMKNESETIKRIQAINAFSMGTLGVSSVIDSIMDNQVSDYIIDLMRQVRKYNESIFLCANEEEAVKLSSTIFEELWSKKNIYIKTNQYIQLIYWETLLQACSLYNKTGITEIIVNIPECFKCDMMDSILVARLNCGEKINRTEIVNFWKKKKNNRILCVYMAKCDTNTATEMVREIPDSMVVPDVVLTYCECFIREKKYEEAGRLLEKYSKICSGYAEYLVDRVEVFRNEEDVNRLADGWKQHNLKYLNIHTDETVANIFYNWKMYDLCLLVICSLEIRGFNNVFLSRLKALSLINTDKAVEGLAALNEIAPECLNDVSVIGNILNCSLALQREVSDEVINAAEKMDSSDIMLHLAVIYEKRGNIHDAKKNYWKAILSNEDIESKVYGAYWLFEINHNKGEVEVELSDEETYIVADELNGNRRISIGVLSKEYIKEELNIGGIIFVPTDNAIKRGWLGKKIDSIVEYEGASYKISAVKTMEACFSGICIEKIINSGNVKVLSVPRNSENDKVKNDFVSFLKANTPDNSDKQDIFNEYKDLSKLPISLFALSQCLRSNYVVSVYNILKNSTLLTREWIEYEYDMDCNENCGFILSFSSLILLFLLKVPVEHLVSNNVYLPKSTLVEIRNEKNEVIIENKRNGGGTISVVDDKIQFFVDSEEYKQELMRYATELLEYAEKIPLIENEKDFSFDNISETSIRSLFGTPDLDAISICKTNHYTLITFELYLTDVSILARNMIISPLAFINCIESEDDVLIEYLNRLLSLHMMNILDNESYMRIVNSKNDKVLISWRNFLERLDKQDTNYKNWIKEHFVRINQQYHIHRNTELPVNDIEKEFAIAVMKLLEREIHYSTGTMHDEDGNIVIRTYLRVFDKVQQKYLEELDQIVDSVFCLETS